MTPYAVHSMHVLLACIPRGPVNWKCRILAFWFCRFLGCRVFLDVSAWNLLLSHQCFEPIPFSFSYVVVVTSIVANVVDIVVVVAFAVISAQTRIFFPLCLCCCTSLQLLNRVANILGGSKSCIYFSFRMYKLPIFWEGQKIWPIFSLGTYLDQVADSASSLLHRLAPHLVEEQLWEDTNIICGKTQISIVRRHKY